MNGIGFTLMDDSVVIVKHGYYYKQCKAYERSGFVYVKVGAGFLKLRKDGATNHPNIKWESAEIGSKNVETEQSAKYLEAENATK